jgi:hypothetical protein
MFSDVLLGLGAIVLLLLVFQIVRILEDWLSNR